MNRQPFQTPPCWWPPKLSQRWVRFWRPLRRRKQLKTQRLSEIEIDGLDNVRRAVDSGHGVLITLNHPSHADCYPIYEAADKLGFPFYIMAAWQVFDREGPISRLVLQHHGCFSVDREGTDMRAFRQALDVLKSKRNPLVIFPEGEVYHVSERVTPFREGPAAIALLAARKGNRPIVCVPAAMKYHYMEDPTADLLKLMDELEKAIHWRPRPDLTIQQRIYHFAEGALALKEVEFLGHTGSGSLPDRVAKLVDFILDRVEARYELTSTGQTVPERVKAVRQNAIKLLEELPDGDPRRKLCGEDLDDVFTAVQLFSYPGDYVSQRPTVERIAETLDKFEEDVLHLPTAVVRKARRATLTFGEPIDVVPSRGKGSAAAALTKTLEQRVQALLDQIPEPTDRGF